MTGGKSDDLPPLLRVVRGAPTPEQLAALVTVVCSLRPLDDSGQEDDDADEGAADPLSEPPAGPDPALWGAPALRSSPAAGPAAWRASGLPDPSR